MTEVNVDIADGTAVVRPASPEIARRLIEAADGKPVATTTAGPTLGFVVAEKVAVAAGLVNGTPAPVGGAAAAKNDDQAPSKNASTDEWRAFFDRQGIEYSEDDTRTDLIEAWERG